jgi:hypothetical protein
MRSQESEIPSSETFPCYIFRHGDAVPTLNWEVEMEKRWGRAFVHESGHAIMAILHGIPCHGICCEFQNDGVKFCALADLPIPSLYTKGHYLFLTAGSAAEQIVYGNRDEDAAKSDVRDFANAGAPPLQESIDAAHSILSSKTRQLKRLVSKLKAKMRQANFDVGNLPEVGMNGSVKRYGVLLSKQELEDALGRA